MTTREIIAFGAVLRRFRLGRGLSQEALAERARLSVSAIAALERGHRHAPRPETVALLAEALGLAPADRAALIAAAVAGRTRSGEQVQSPVVVPPLAAPAAPISRPPTPPTPLVGREQEVAALTHLLRPAGGARLLTLTGPGGVGKTRLALAVADAVRADFPDGIAFVDLAPLRDPALVASTVAQSLGLRESGEQSPRDLLLTHLRAKRLLLVLDNVEQVVEAAPLVADLVNACPGLVALVTSRAPLRLRAEQRFAVQPLAIPATRQETVGELGGVAAARLFVSRAQAVQADFALTAENMDAVAAICRHLDGLPLALELAAARITLLAPTALLARLEHRLAVLRGGAHDLPERQQALRATIAWSYVLLPQEVQALFRALSVFVGGCTLEAAEAVAAPAGVSGDMVLEGLETLVDHSLLRSVGQPHGEARFQMLETIQEYGLEQLAAGNAEVETRRAHAAYYVALAEAAEPRLFGSEQMHWLELLERDHANLRAALSWLREQQDMARGLLLVGRLWRFWYIRCHLSEGRNWLQEYVERPAGPDAEAARLDALVGLAVIAYAQTAYEQAALVAGEGVALARTLDSGPNLVVLLNILGGVARYHSDFGRAAALGEECVALTRSIDDRWSLALSLSNLAEVARLQGDYERAAALCDESLGLSQDQGDQWGIAQAMLTLGRIARDRGSLVEATTLFDAGLTIVQELGHTRDIALALAGLGRVAYLQRDYGGAAALFEQGLALLQPLGDKLREADVQTALGRAYQALGDDERATDLHQESLAVFQALGHKLGLAEGLESLAAVCGPRQAERATHMLAAAATLREAIGSPLAPAERPDYEHEVEALRTLLGDQGFAAAWAAGQAMTPQQAMAEATPPVAEFLGS